MGVAHHEAENIFLVLCTLQKNTSLVGSDTLGGSPTPTAATMSRRKSFYVTGTVHLNAK